MVCGKTHFTGSRFYIHYNSHDIHKYYPQQKLAINKHNDLRNWILGGLIVFALGGLIGEVIANFFGLPRGILIFCI